MDGLLQAYSAAAGSPQSPTMGQPGESAVQCGKLMSHELDSMFRQHCDSCDVKPHVGA